MTTRVPMLEVCADRVVVHDGISKNAYNEKCREVMDERRSRYIERKLFREYKYGRNERMREIRESAKAEFYGKLDALLDWRIIMKITAVLMTIVLFAECAALLYSQFTDVQTAWVLSGKR